jgi:hypothetical protein
MISPQRSPVLTKFDATTTVDEAWTLPNASTLTNTHLRFGDLVELEAATKGDFVAGAFVVPRGTLGHVTDPKAHRPELTSGDESRYLAVVEVSVEGCVGQLRVPHAALRIMTQVTPRIDDIRRNRQ